MKLLLQFILLSILLLISTPDSEAEKRRALVIGLGEQLDPSWGKINGDKDVPLVTSMLRENMFTDIRTLVNSQATKNNIVKAMNSLISRSGKGDIVYIHFSGHGQLMTDTDGDEKDGWDESWIPFDAYRRYSSSDKGEKHISDDEVAEFMARLKEKIGASGCIAVVVDACHSGDSTREVMKNDTLVVRGIYEKFNIPVKNVKRTSPTRETWLTLSACKDFQLNQEYMGFGKLTHILVNNWREFAGRSDVAICNEIEKKMQSRKYKGPMAQNPDLSGEKGNILSKIFIKKR